MDTATPAVVTGRLPLRRPPTGRRLAGVCAGVAAHLDVPVGRVRLLAVTTSLVGGAGVVLYLWLWLTVPPGDPAAVVAQARPAGRRLAPGLRTTSSRFPVTDVAVGLLLLAAAGLLLAWRAGVDLAAGWLLPALVLLGGAGLAWSQLDAVEREATVPSRGRTPAAALRVGGGALLAVIGVLLLVVQGQAPADLLRALAAGFAVMAGLVLVLAPLWLGLVRDLGSERAARAREAERADIAAHLHDSVLQTLALIRARAGDADAVARLARAQERELRAWLYADRPRAGDSLAAAVKEVAAEVEDRYGVPVDVVTAGDRRPGPGCDALLAATREALTNAVVHGRPPVSVFAEVAPDCVELYVRDRGDGFDLDAVPADRFGVRESVLARMRRHGGEAGVRTGPDRGTEVRLVATAAMLAGRPGTAEPAAGRDGVRAGEVRGSEG